MKGKKREVVALIPRSEFPDGFSTNRLIAVQHACARMLEILVEQYDWPYPSVLPGELVQPLTDRLFAHQGKASRSTLLGKMGKMGLMEKASERVGYGRGACWSPGRLAQVPSSFLLSEKEIEAALAQACPDKVAVETFLSWMNGKVFERFVPEDFYTVDHWFVKGNDDWLNLEIKEGWIIRTNRAEGIITLGSVNQLEKPMRMREPGGSPTTEIRTTEIDFFLQTISLATSCRLVQVKHEDPWRIYRLVKRTYFQR